MKTNYIEHRHENGVEVYHFKAVTRAAIDEFYTIVRPIYAKHVEQYEDKIPLFYVMDLTESGMFPVKYMMNKAIQEISVHKYQPQQYVAYVITNTQDQMLINILEQLALRNLANTRKIFKPEQLDAAVQWLQDVRATFVDVTP